MNIPIIASNAVPSNKFRVKKNAKFYKFRPRRQLFDATDITEKTDLLDNSYEVRDWSEKKSSSTQQVSARKHIEKCTCTAPKNCDIGS
jgi:hypothetical protein